MYKKNKNYEQEAHQNEERLLEQKKLYEQILEQKVDNVRAYAQTYGHYYAVKVDKRYDRKFGCIYFAGMH
jgi:hypothetical protein